MQTKTFSKYTGINDLLNIILIYVIWIIFYPEADFSLKFSAIKSDIYNLAKANICGLFIIRRLKPPAIYCLLNCFLNCLRLQPGDWIMIKFNIGFSQI